MESKAHARPLKPGEDLPKRVKDTPSKHFRSLKQAYQAAEKPVEPANVIKTQDHQKRKFPAPGLKALGLGITAVVLAVEGANALQPSNKATADPENTPQPSSHIRTERYSDPDSGLHVNIPPNSEVNYSEDVKEIYTGSYRISRGIQLRDGPHSLVRSSVPDGDKPGDEISWDEVSLIKDVPLGENSAFIIGSAQIAYGDNPAGNMNSEGLWIEFPATLKDGTSKTLYASLGPQTDDWVKVEKEGEFLTTTEALSLGITPEKTNVITVPTDNTN